MYTSLGKMLIFFSADAVENADKVDFNGGKLQIMRPVNPNEYSLETAIVFAVSNTQQFFKPGDRVLVEYSIFQQGKFRDRTKQRTRLFDVTAEGELYWAFDGHDGWNKAEVYGRLLQVDGRQVVEMAEQFVMVDSPKEAPWAVNPNGLLVQAKEDREKAFWVSVVAAHPSLDLDQEEILVEGGLAMPIFWDGREAAIVDSKYIIATRSKSRTHG